MFNFWSLLTRLIGKSRRQCFISSSINFSKKKEKGWRCSLKFQWPPPPFSAYPHFPWPWNIIVIQTKSVYLNSNFTLIYPNFLNITLSVSDDWNSEQPCTDISLWIIIFIYYYRQFKNHLDMLKCVLYFELRLLFNLLVS